MMPWHFGKLSLDLRLVQRGSTRNMHTTYGIIMEKKGREHDENLRAALGRMGLNSRAVEDVMDKVRNRHYQLACTLTFEAVHSSSCDAGTNHPNQYFVDSQRILQSKNGSVA